MICPECKTEHPKEKMVFFGRVLVCIRCWFKLEKE